LGEARDQLGERVKEIRLSQGKTQEDVAERAGLSYKFIGEVERGIANPSVDTLDRLAGALGVQLSDFFGTTRTTAYPVHDRDVPMVREVLASLESVIARLQRATPPTRSRRRRPSTR